MHSNGLAVVVPLLLLLCAGAGLVSAQSGGCYVPGFTLKQRQQPAGTTGGLVLYTTPHTPLGSGAPLPRPHSTLAATPAACEADDACVMFTSDGYTIAAHSFSFAAKPSQQAPSEADVSWQSMPYCPGACCGTWVADSFTAQLRSGGAASQQQQTRTVLGATLPRDSDGAEFLARSLLQTVCAGKPAELPAGFRVAPGSGVGSPNCPQRCVVACCKQLQDGQPFSGHSDNKLVMGRYLFNQCSAKSCAACKFGEWAAIQAPTATYCYGSTCAPRLWRRLEAGTPRLLAVRAVAEQFA